MLLRVSLVLHSCLVASSFLVPLFVGYLDLKSIGGGLGVIELQLLTKLVYSRIKF